jgi:glyoxylase-like metal-dependent hydrolase (beta-lactamase superfamily II)
MRALDGGMTIRRYALAAVTCGGLIGGAGMALGVGGPLAAQNGPGAAAPGDPYVNMPALAPIGVRVARYAPVPESARGPAVDPAKGYRTQDLGGGLYMLADGAYQSLFLVYEDGVVVVDAPPQYAAKIPAAVAEVTPKPITHLVYSHAHSDHIGGARAVGGKPIIIAHAETNRLLIREGDPDRPPAAVTFDAEYRLSVGSQRLELSYHGTGHQPGNIFIHAPKQRVLMVVDDVVVEHGPGVAAIGDIRRLGGARAHDAR